MKKLFTAIQKRAPVIHDAINRAPVIHDAINRAIMFSRWNVKNINGQTEVYNTKAEAAQI